MARGACHFCAAAVTVAAAPNVGHGVAELLQALNLPGGFGAGGQVVSSSTTTFVVGGKTYSRLEDLPPDERAKVEAKLAKLAALGIRR